MVESNLDVADEAAEALDSVVADVESCRDSVS